ncbi:MAG: Ig-like domain-containing protein, partial [Actinobacteria bacterium]|nr:Ig-like domain-containing protein [Actinomycetota bacterium]
GTHPKNPTGLTTNVSSTCTSSETSTTGSTTITNGMLETDSGWDDNANGNYLDPGDHPPVRVTVPVNPAANTTYTGHLHVNGVVETWTYKFNEKVTNTDGSLTVYAGHQIIEGPTAVGHLYFGKSQCGVKRTTTTTLASSANPSTVGQSVTFTATVARVHGTGTPTGTVQFKVDGVNSGTPVTLVAGQATKALSNLTAGSHAITAVYAGKLAFLGSTGTLTQQVN